MTINHKQLGFTIASLDGDAGILRITGTRPSARSCGVSEGDVVERGERRVSLTIRHILEFLLAEEAYWPQADVS